MSDPDYKTMSREAPGKMLQLLGDDATKWATFYCQIHQEADWADIAGWFANVIENAWETRMRRTQTNVPTLKLVGTPQGLCRARASNAAILERLGGVTPQIADSEEDDDRNPNVK